MQRSLTLRIRGTALVATAALLGACAPSTDPILTQFFREAGAISDTGYFGNATNTNTLIQNGELAYAGQLNERFAAEVRTTVTFPFNSSRLEPAAMDVLREQANFIRQFPEVRFRVYGHTDLVGSAAYNKKLGLARANSVVAFLTSQGISRSRLEALVSYGESRPVVLTDDRERRNRRTVTEVSGFVKANQRVLDGKYAEIVYRDYVASAVPPSQLSGITGADLRTDQ